MVANPGQFNVSSSSYLGPCAKSAVCALCVLSAQSHRQDVLALISRGVAHYYQAQGRVGSSIAMSACVAICHILGIVVTTDGCIQYCAYTGRLEAGLSVDALPGISQRNERTCIE